MDQTNQSEKKNDSLKNLKSSQDKANCSLNLGNAHLTRLNMLIVVVSPRSCCLSRGHLGVFLGFYRKGQDAEDFVTCGTGLHDEELLCPKLPHQ